MTLRFKPHVQNLCFVIIPLLHVSDMKANGLEEWHYFAFKFYFLDTFYVFTLFSPPFSLSISPFVSSPCMFVCTSAFSRLLFIILACTLFS